MKFALSLLIAGSLLSADSSWAQPRFSSFTEDKKAPERSRAYTKFQEERAKNTPDAPILAPLKSNYQQFIDRVTVPGFMSASPLPDIGTIVGPANVNASFRIGDRVFIQWQGTPGPRVGDRYAVFSPAVVMQSVLDPTDFSIRSRPERADQLPSNFRLAGFFYETSGRIRITKVSQGLVEAVIEGLSGQVAVSDQLMPVIPVKTNIKPAVGGIQLAAAVVSGSPVDRLSTTKRSFIYINRGSRDGIREGRVFQAVESVPLDRSVAAYSPEISVGEAMVVHVTDSYATAMITRQFDVIRIGSLLKTKQIGSPIESNEPFKNLFPGGRGTSPDLGEEIPYLGEPGFSPDPSLPLPEIERSQPPPGPTLSELDALEQSQKFNSLTPQERSRLGRLSRQQGIDGSRASETDDLDAPSTAPVDNSFRRNQPKKPARRPPARRSSDEEELNNLMMMN